MTEFETFKKLSTDYKVAVDALGEPYKRETASDLPYSTETIVRRVEERNDRYNDKIESLAASAADKAAPEIGKLRDKLGAYITRSDPDKIATLQALIASGVELTSFEIESFARGACYAVLKLLERPSKGHVQAPDVDALRRDLRKIETHFQNLQFYRGDLAKIGTLSMFGQSSTVSSIAVSNSIDGFPAHLDEIATRWTCVLEGDAK